jgi:hypothetical protein
VSDPIVVGGVFWLVPVEASVGVAVGVVGVATCISSATSLVPSSTFGFALSYLGGSPGFEESTQYAELVRESMWTKTEFG